MKIVKMIETKTKKGQYYPNQYSYQLVLNPGRCKVVAEYQVYDMNKFQYKYPLFDELGNFKNYSNGRLLDINIQTSGFKRIFKRLK
jgi:hypothetical protein